jgi:hypothetical protein
MQYDLGVTGLGILVVFSLGFGVIAQIAGRTEPRLAGSSVGYI